MSDLGASPGSVGDGPVGARHPSRPAKARAPQDDGARAQTETRVVATGDRSAASCKNGRERARRQGARYER